MIEDHYFLRIIEKQRFIYKMDIYTLPATTVVYRITFVTIIKIKGLLFSKIALTPYQSF